MPGVREDDVDAAVGRGGVRRRRSAPTASSVTSTTAVRTSQPPCGEPPAALGEPLGVDVGERDARAALGQHLGGRETEPARGAGHDGAPAADVEEARRHRCGVDAHPACTSTFIASAGLSIANAIAAGASSSANSCVISGSTASLPARDERDRLGEVVGAAGADAEHVELAERQGADRAAAPRASRGRRRARGPSARPRRGPRASAPARRSPRPRPRAARRRPIARARDEIVAGLEQREVGAGRAAALEPRGDAVDHQHRARRGRARRSRRPARSGPRRARARARRPRRGRARPCAPRSTSAR